MNFNMIDRLIEILIEVKEEINKILSKDEELSIAEKGVANYVTEVDVFVEKFLQDKLLFLLPGSNFIGEEGVQNVKREELGTYNEYSWVVDPIDGTTNFINNFPYAISIGLINSKERVLGIVFDVRNDTVYFAIKNMGAYKQKINDPSTRQELHVRKNRKTVSGSFICMDFPYGEEKKQMTLDIMASLMKRGSTIKTIGPISLDICHVAEGMFHMCFHVEIRPWDIAAASLILEEAGGKYTRLDGTKEDIDSFKDYRNHLDFIVTNSDELSFSSLVIYNNVLEKYKKKEEIE